MKRRGALHDKEISPVFNVTTLRGGQSAAPKLSGIATRGKQAAEVWSAMAEDNLMTV